MILFNSIFSPNIFETLSPFIINANVASEVKALKTSSTLKHISSLAYAVNHIDYLSESRFSLSRKRLINSNAWSNFTKSFWQQPIFLYVPSKITDKYMSQLESLAINRNRGANKLLLSQFSKSLNNNLIYSSSCSNSLKNTESPPVIQYFWPKACYLNYKTWLNLFNFDEIKLHFKNMQKTLNNNSGFNRMPIYAVSNRLGEIVISEPPQKNNFHSGILRLSKYNTGNVYESWFFINFEDAQEYMEYINSCYGLNSINALKILACDLGTFYEISSKYSSYIMLRLVPDLNEVGRLLNKYRYHGNIIFHKKQVYGTDYFQGQPVYIVKDGLKNQENISCSYHELLDKKEKTSGIVFTNYDTALRIWLKLTRKADISTSLNKPRLIVYNLEKFLQDKTSVVAKQSEEFLLVPSLDSYKYVLRQHRQNKYNSIYRELIDGFLFCQLWTKRIFWSLTSKQP